MEFKFPNSKKLFLTVEISQLLYSYGVTYAEAESILELITSEIKQQRENLEYDTLDDYFSGQKSRVVDDMIIKPLNHVYPYA